MNRIQAAEQLRKALQIFAQTLADDKAMEIACVYPTWETNRGYSVGEICGYGENAVGDPQLYRCAQAHTSQDDWTPNVAVSLWTSLGIADDGIPVWSQPVGAHDAYNVGDRVHYPDENGDVWECQTNANVYAPGVFGWVRI